jgi:hypothetical protein
VGYIRKKKGNKYVEHTNYYEGFTSNGISFLIDKDDYNKVSKYTWYLDGKGHLRTNIGKEGLALHRYIMDAKDGQILDHINRIKIDNQKENLRFVTKRENNINRDIQSNNTSGVVGVYYNKTFNKWHARVTVNRKNIHLGYFKLLEDAKEAREIAEKQYYNIKGEK